MQKIKIKEVLEKYSVSGFSTFDKDISLLIKNNGEILFRGNNIGFIVDKESEGLYHQFIVLTLQRSISDADFNKVIDIIADCANDLGYLVIFVPMLDIGFGIKVWDAISDKATIISNLLKVAKFSKEDVKTAAAIVANSNSIVNKVTDEDFIYSYNQKLYGKVVHAEQVLKLFVDENKQYVRYTNWYSLIEPCKNCLENMIDLGAIAISFLTSHKKKWNTDEYFDIVDKIQIGIIKNKSPINNKLVKISYNKINNVKVNKFYRRMKYDSLS